MELRHLRYFIAVAEELNFSKAALRLYTAQPSLSQQIKDLEEEIGVRLFNRTKRKVELTEEGIIFLEQARLTIAQAERSIYLVRKAYLSKQQILRIGFITAAEIRIFPRILPNFRIQHPNFKIELNILNDHEQHQALIKDELDIIFTRQVVTHDQVENHIVFKDDLALILPKQDPLSTLEHIPRSTLTRLNIITPTSSSLAVLNQAVTQFIEKHHITFKSQVKTQTIVDTLNLINAGRGCAILPKYVDPFSSLPNLAFRTLDVELPTLDLVMSYKKQNTSAALQCFLEMIDSLSISSNQAEIPSTSTVKI
ncbi:LysR substrate-binding domain-containing protein [Acinetobacter boissieri]|uniref:LysR family transcriptional regulator, hca operon transcriptional activator n=1 Tax=Acinetobacter boissieri TaxID=1219383 RepID=A0A1G6HYL6_9GAMM|nr:LysR substrate-binding domain-containing protein [Acinetobacter boissieri]SDB98915.1 LysR family transcriptional regulator, hca operon transcriptional activator [Acinetobacter boissieri]